MFRRLHKENKTKLIEKLLHIWKSDPINNLKTLLRKIEENVIDLETKDQKINYKKLNFIAIFVPFF